MSNQKRLEKLASKFVDEARGLGMTDEEIISVTKAVFTAMSNQSSKPAQNEAISKDEYIELAYNAIYAKLDMPPHLRVFSREHLEIPLGIMYVIHNHQYNELGEFVEQVEKTTGLSSIALIEHVLSQTISKVHPGLRFLMNICCGKVDAQSEEKRFDSKAWDFKTVREKMEILEEVEANLGKIIKEQKGDKAGLL